MEDRRPPLTRSLVLVIVIGAILLTSLKIISYGFMPSDDALRHAAKAVTQKSWPEIVVMRPLVFDDQHAGWHSFLGAVYQATGCTKEDLVVLSVVLLATLFLVAPIPWLRRPEIWPLVWVYVAIAADPFVVGRIFLGRPFIFTMAVVLTLCLVWPRLKSERLPVGTLVLLLVAVALCTWFHGMPHLFLIPLLAFALAREWLAALRLAVVLVLGILLGASLTGHPILLIWEAWLHSQRAFLDSPLQHMLVTEFQSYAGEGTLPLAILLVLLWRWARGEWDSQKIVRDPVFILMSLGWLLGFTVMRFWTDWGLVAALAWCARELDEVAQRKLPIFSNKRLAVALVGGAFCLSTSRATSGGDGQDPSPGRVYRRKTQICGRCCRNRVGSFIATFPRFFTTRSSTTPTGNGGTLWGLSRR